MGWWNTTSPNDLVGWLESNCLPVWWVVQRWENLGLMEKETIEMVYNGDDF